MAKMKVKNFVEKAVKVEKLSTLYKLGKFMNSKDGKYLLCDCSGLIKGILWGYPENGKYASNGVPDINANTMIKQCSKVSTTFDKLPYGALVWMEGHIGIHVGNGVCIESSPKWEDGIQRTFIKGSGYVNSEGLNIRKWTQHGLFDKYIDYSAPTTAYYNKYTGKSLRIDTVFKAIGAPYGSVAKRKPVAEKNGYKGTYRGTLTQNLKLIALAKQGKLKK